MKLKKTIQTLIISIFITILSVSSSYATEPTFKFYPEGGTVANKNEGFIVDVLIDSAGEKLSSARFVVTFDPRIIKIKKAERNNSLFEQWPSDESSLDNESGVVMLTGFTQSGTSDLYITGDSPDVMARLSFEVVKEGTVTLDWEFSGSNDTFKTVMLKDGSPPQNILNIKPNSASFQIGKVIYDPSKIDAGFSIDKYILSTGLVLILFGGLLLFSKPEKLKKGRGTIVLDS